MNYDVRKMWTIFSLSVLLKRVLVTKKVCSHQFLYIVYTILNISLITQWNINIVKQQAVNSSQAYRSVWRILHKGQLLSAANLSTAVDQLVLGEFVTQPHQSPKTMTNIEITVYSLVTLIVGKNEPSCSKTLQFSCVILEFDYFASISSPGDPVIMYGMLKYNIPHSFVINFHQYLAFYKPLSKNF